MQQFCASENMWMVGAHFSGLYDGQNYQPVELLPPAMGVLSFLPGQQLTETYHDLDHLQEQGPMHYDALVEG